MKVFSLVVLAILSFAAPCASAEEPFLFVPLQPAAAADGQALAQVKAQAAQMKLKGVEIFEKQSFRLMGSGKSLGVFVTGRVITPTDPDNLACFVTMVESQSAPEILLTAGDGSNGERCGVVRTVGLVGSASADRIYIGVVFDASVRLMDRPGRAYLDQMDARVFLWNEGAHRLSFDRENTERVGDAETLPAMQRALR